MSVQVSIWRDWMRFWRITVQFLAGMVFLVFLVQAASAQRGGDCMNACKNDCLDKYLQSCPMDSGWYTGCADVEDVALCERYEDLERGECLGKVGYCGFVECVEYCAPKEEPEELFPEDEVPVEEPEALFPEEEIPLDPNREIPITYEDLPDNSSDPTESPNNPPNDPPSPTDPPSDPPPPFNGPPSDPMSPTGPPNQPPSDPPAPLNGPEPLPLPNGPLLPPPLPNWPPEEPPQMCAAIFNICLWDDPHMQSADGVKFNFQAAGEFHLAQSAGRDIDIQVRLSGYGSQRNVTMVTAMAARGGDARITFDPARDTLIAINGEPVGIQKGMLNAIEHPSGIYLIRQHENYYRAALPGNTLLTVWDYGDMLNIEVTSVPALIGLGGSNDGDPANDFTPRGGAALPVDDGRLTYEQLYTQFGDSWRVTDEDSLFDYVDGTILCTLGL